VEGTGDTAESCQTLNLPGGDRVVEVQNYGPDIVPTISADNEMCKGCSGVRMSRNLPNACL